MTEEQRNSKRKRQTFHPKRQSGQQKRPRTVDLRQNGRGILVTAGAANYTKDALREALAVLNAEVDSTRPSSSSTSTAPAELSEAVDAELAQLKADSDRFIPIDSLTKGVCFIQFRSIDDEPNELTRRILEKLAMDNPKIAKCKETDRETKEGETTTTEKEGEQKDAQREEAAKRKISCRFMNRLVPTELTCPPHMTNFKRAIKLLIQAYFAESALVLHPEEFEEDKEGNAKADESEEKSKASESEEKASESEKSKGSEVPGQEQQPLRRSEEVKSSFKVPKGAAWCVYFERRAGMKTLDRESVVVEVGKMVGANYTVNLTKPEYSVVIEVNNVFCGMSVVRDFSRLLRYNIHRLCHPEEEQPSTEKKEKPQQENKDSAEKKEKSQQENKDSAEKKGKPQQESKEEKEKDKEKETPQ